MAERIGRSFLGGAAERLARSLGIDGLLSPKMEADPPLITTIKAIDCTGPGNHSYRGRRFYGNLGAGNATGDGIIADEGVVITDVAIIPQTAASVFSLRYYGPADADPAAGTYPTSIPLLENAASFTEAAPVRKSNAVAFVAGGTVILADVAQNLTVIFYARIDLFMRPGSKLFLAGGTVGATVRCNFHGYVF